MQLIDNEGAYVGVSGKDYAADLTILKVELIKEKREDHSIKDGIQSSLWAEKDGRGEIYEAVDQ